MAKEKECEIVGSAAEDDARQAQLEAEAAYLRQGYEVALRTDFVDLDAVRAHARHILDTCDGGRLMLDRFRHWVERAKQAEREAEALRALFSLALDFYKSAEAVRRDGDYHPRFIEAMDAAQAMRGEDGGWLLNRMRDFYLQRMDALQRYQHELPEPHRTAVCNILANGTPGPSAHPARH